MDATNWTVPKLGDVQPFLKFCVVYAMPITKKQPYMQLWRQDLVKTKR